MRNGTARARGWGARLFTTTALTGLAATVIAVALPGDARAAGFALKEQSTTAQGNAFAGATAGAEDVTYMFFNPAGLIRHEGMQAAAVISYISPHAETTDASSAPLTGSSNQDGGVEALVPAFYGMWSASPDLKVGLGINTPFGLKTRYSEGWVGRMYAIESEVLTVNINPVVAYRINQMVSVGAGLQVQYMDVLLSNDLTGGGVIGELTGDDWAFGATLGLLIEFSESTRVGIGYRSRIAHTLEGDFESIPLTDTVTADFTTPDQATIGVYHDISPQFAVMAEAGWTSWSTFDEIRVKFDSGAPDSVVDEDWDNVWFGAIGATWRPNDQLTLRAGVAYDQSPIPDNTRTPRIPGNDRTWVSLGASYTVSPAFSIDAGYTHIFVQDSDVDVSFAGLQLTATFENSVDIAVLQATFRF